MLISEIKPDRQSMNIPSEYFIVTGSRDTIVRDKKTLALIVDEPCLKACEYLYECNVLTLNSSANCQDSLGYITLDYKSLSDENKIVYSMLIKEGIIQESSLEEQDGHIAVNIHIPITPETTVEEFSDKMLGIASLFQHQDILYGVFDEKSLRDKIAKMLEEDSYMFDLITHTVDFIMDGIYKKEISASPNGNVDIDGILYNSDDFIDYIINSEMVKKYFYYDEDEKKYWIHEDLYKKHLEWKKSQKISSKVFPFGDEFDIDTIISSIQKENNISDHRFGTSDCFDLGKYVLMRYCQKNANGFARDTAEFDMDEINKKVLMGVNTPRHLVVKREILDEINYCYIIQDKVKGKCCEDLSVEEILKIPQEHYNKLVNDLFVLRKSGVDPKIHNYYYDPKVGFCFIDLNPGFDYRYNCEISIEDICDYIPTFAIRNDLMFSDYSKEIGKIEDEKIQNAYSNLVSKLPVMPETKEKEGIKR